AMPGPRTMGSEAPQPSRPELPAVVQRTPANPTPSLPTASPLLAAPPLPAGSPPPAPAPRGLVADAGPGLSESPLLGSDHDHAHRPTAPDPVVSTAAVDPSAAVPVVARSVLSEPPAPALSAAVTGSPDPLQPSEPAVESDQQELSSSPGWTEVALPVPASPLSGGSVPGAPSAPEISLASPPVSSPLPTTAAAASLSPTVSRLAGAAPATAGLSPSTSAPPAGTDVGPGSAPVQRSVVVGTAVRPPTAPAPPSGSRPSLEPEAHVPATRSIPWDESTEPIGATESTEELERPIVGTGGVSELSSTTATDRGTTSDPFGAVISLPSVQRQPAPAAGPGARPAAATPVVARPRPETGSPLAIGAPLVQRSSVPGPPTPSPAVEVSGVARSFASMFGGPGAGASGATAGTADTVQAAAVAIAAPSGRTVPGVQRRSLDDASSGVDDGAAATPEPAGPTADTAVDGAALTTGSTAATTTPAAPAGAAPAPTDLDEMARRLYEPLVARLRAELWLDRERAGVFGDG
ncbi:MAG TPA: hypothetical protein VFU98_01865, partial [Microlunatus sp.]|nr:hypothetical protein [Microlunatus sp.]